MPNPKNLSKPASATNPAKPAKPSAPAPQKPQPAKAVPPTSPAVPVKPAPARPVPTAPLAPVGKASVAVPIPGFLQRTTMPQTSNRQLTGYVGFASTQSKKWNLMQQAGLDEGQPFLYHQNNYIPVDQLDFFLCMGDSFQTMMVGKNGTFIYATRDMAEQVPQRVYNNQVVKAEPHYVCLILANLNGQLIPIKGDFRGTKSGGMENAIRAVEAASDPDWLQLSDIHKATAAFPQPWGRVCHSITTRRGVSKSTGNPFFAAQCSSTPATVSQLQLLVSHLRDEQFTATLNEAKTNYDSRVQFLDDVSSGKAVAPVTGSTDSQPVDPVTGDPVPF